MLDQVSLQIGAGEFVGIVGCTGCGKTTLLKAMAGLLEVQSGEILLDGENIFSRRFDRAVLRRKVGMVFQYPEYQLFAQTVEKDVGFGLKYSRLSREEKQERVRWALEQMGFEIEASHHECAIGQHEIDFKYVDALDGADKIMTLKLAVKTLAQKNGLSLVECDLITGRTHQIRAQFAHAGHPLIGDGKYGRERENKKYGRHGQALYSYRLEFHFTTDAGPLAGLDGKSFQVEDVDFVSEYFPNYHWKETEAH